MDWLFLGLSSTGLHAGISVVDKVILERYLKNSWAYPFFTALFLGLYCLGILTVRLALSVFHPPSVLAGSLALLPGLLHYGAALLFTLALLQEDASTVAGISQVGPIFGVLWGTLFLGDRFAALNYAGIIVLVVCAVLLAWEKPVGAAVEPDLPLRLDQPHNRSRLSRALWLVLLGALLRSLSDLFTKIAVTDLAFWDAFALNRLGMLAPALLLFMTPTIRAAVVAPVKRHGPRVILMVAAVEMFALMNLMLVASAYASGPLALVSATQSTVPLFILALTAGVNRLRPGLVPVKNNGLSAWVKLGLCAGIFLGVYLLSFRS